MTNGFIDLISRNVHWLIVLFLGSSFLTGLIGLAAIVFTVPIGVLLFLAMIHEARSDSARL